MGVGGQRHAPAALPPRRKLGTRCTGGWVWTDAKNVSHHRDSMPGPLIPVTSRYIDYAIPAHKIRSTRGKAPNGQYCTKISDTFRCADNLFEGVTQNMAGGGTRHSVPVQTGAGAHTASYTTGNGSVPEGEAAEA